MQLTQRPVDPSAGSGQAGGTRRVFGAFSGSQFFSPFQQGVYPPTQPPVTQAVGRQTEKICGKNDMDESGAR